MWDEITYQFPNFNGAAVEVWEWISNFIPLFTKHVVTYPCWCVSHYRTLTTWWRDASSCVTSSKNAWVSRREKWLPGVASSYWNRKLWRLGDAYVLRCSGLSLVQTMACWLFGGKPLPKAILNYCILRNNLRVNCIRFNVTAAAVHSRELDIESYEPGTL